jgi:hypothetical protein
MSQPVSTRRVQLALNNGIVGAIPAAAACRQVGLNFPAACALLLMESRGGENVYGGDVGGALRRYPHPVDESNFKVFEWLVEVEEFKSNGVGPCQITYYPYFDQMFHLGLRPWLPVDNMIFGFDILQRNFDKQINGHTVQEAWERAATLYNVGNLKSGVNDYGRLFFERYTKLRRYTLH